ncbi:MAG: 16S rRNA (guanine(966)-N(2))-methyltransferase RsmD [Acidobacteria bacterium]|nr:16S rRNA (guanine(966)-N(2))-methyltransferase RsmD [Acidobacteriota bacterium]
MRVIAGRFKGRRLQTPKWEGIRPTSDRLRETLFNILAPRIEGARVLDGFAGTGAIGIEALSRGARHVTFVERDRRAAALIAANLARCGIEEGYTIECGDVAPVLRRAPADAGFDLILLDPPYDADPVLVTRALAAAADRLAPDGVLVLEHATRRAPAIPPAFERVRAVASGDSTLTFVRRA